MLDNKLIEPLDVGWLAKESNLKLIEHLLLRRIGPLESWFGFGHGKKLTMNRNGCPAKNHKSFQRTKLAHSENPP